MKALHQAINSITSYSYQVHFSMANLSLCMIVRNEETRLADALESARRAVDEMIVVDTGSADKTVEIARSFGGRVYTFEWVDDFSAARNFALEQATGDWILHLDADEELDEEDIEQARSFIERDDIDGVYVQIYNHERGADGEKRVVIHPYPRLFRRSPEIRYQGIIQEFLTGLNRTVPSSIRIYHYGYLEPGDGPDARQARNEAICKRQLEKDPSNPVAHFNIAGLYLGKQRLEEARTHLEEAIRLISPEDKQFRHFYLLALHYLAALYALQGEPGKAMECCTKAIQLQPDYLDSYFLLGELQFQLGRLADAEKTFLGFIELRERLLRQPARSLYGNSRLGGLSHALLRLGNVYEASGNWHKAEQHYHQAIGADPRSVEANLQLARFYTDRMDVAKAKQYLEAARNLQRGVTEGN